MNAWLYLLFASVLEIIFALMMKFSDGFSRPLPSIASFLFGVAGVYVLSLALKTIPLGTGYAVWTGIGVVGTAVLGILFFGESKDVLRILSILLILAGVIGLRLVTAVTHP